jgi:hypothetical protein
MLRIGVSRSLAAGWAVIAAQTLNVAVRRDAAAAETIRPAGPHCQF